MDEPLSNLDAKLRLEMRAEIRRIHNELGATTIYVTHDQDEALSLADRIVVLRDGVVRQVGTPKELYEAPAHLDVADFMGFRNKLKGQVVAARGRPRRRRRGGRADQRHRPGARRRRRSTACAAIRPDDLVVGRGRRRMPSPRASTPSSIAAANSSGRRIRTAGSTSCSAPIMRSSPARTIHLRSDGRARSRLRGADPGEAVMDAVAPAPAIEHGPNLRQRLAARGFDAVTLLVVPAAIFTLAALRLSLRLRLRPVVRAEGRRRLARQLPALLLGSVSLRDDRQRRSGSRSRSRSSTCCWRCRSRSACASCGVSAF